MNGSWQVVKSKTVLKDRWIDLRADDCLTPEGVTIAPYYVLSYPDWINIVAITKDDRLLLVRQYRHAAGKFFLELPGGGLDERDVDSEKAARRELEEETGYIAENWQLISSLYPNPASHTNRLHIYLATGAEHKYLKRLDDGEEGLTVHALPIAEVLDGLQAGLIGQALHVYGRPGGLAKRYAGHHRVAFFHGVQSFANEFATRSCDVVAVGKSYPDWVRFH